MARVLKRVEHDWVMVTVKFESGAEAKAKWSRGGSDVTVAPRDPAAAKALSIIVSQAEKSGMTVGKVADEMERVGLASRGLADYLAGLKAAFGVSGEQPKPAVAGPEKAQVTLRQSRGWEVAGTFPSGERFELKINKSSVGLRSNPLIASRDSDLINIVFAMKNAGFMDDQEMAERIKDAADASVDTDGWIESVRGIMAPAPRR